MIFKSEEIIGMIKSEIIRKIQNQTGDTAAKLEQVLQIPKGRKAL